MSTLGVIFPICINSLRSYFSFIQFSLIHEFGQMDFYSSVFQSGLPYLGLRRDIGHAIAHLSGKR